MSAIEFELEEEERLIPIERSHLMWGRCRCGERALVAPGRVARCSTCAEFDAGQARAPERIEGLPALGQGFPRHAAAEREAFPAPLVTSREPWDGSGCPSPVLKLAEKARAASWRVRVQRSRGCAPNAATGRAGAVKWRYALVLARPDGAWSAYAVYDADGETWKSVMLWGATRPWFPFASVTDLAEYVAAGGEMSEGWYAGIRERVADTEERRKQRLKCDRGEHAGTEFTGLSQSVRCTICGNVWQMSEEPWRKPRKGRGEAL